MSRVSQTSHRPTGPARAGGVFPLCSLNMQTHHHQHLSNTTHRSNTASGRNTSSFVSVTSSHSCLLYTQLMHKSPCCPYVTALGVPLVCLGALRSHRQSPSVPFKCFFSTRSITWRTEHQPTLKQQKLQLLQRSLDFKTESKTIGCCDDGRKGIYEFTRLRESLPHSNRDLGRRRRRRRPRKTRVRRQSWALDQKD